MHWGLEVFGRLRDKQALQKIVKKKTEPKLALKKYIDYVVWDTNNYVETEIVLGYSTQRDLMAGGLNIIIFIMETDFSAKESRRLKIPAGCYDLH